MNLLEVRLDKLIEILGTDTEHGLTEEQVLQNRQEFGENILFEKKHTVVDLFKKIFGDVMMVLFLILCFFDYLGNRNLSSLVAMLFVILLYAVFALGKHWYVLRAKRKIKAYLRYRYHVRRSGRIQSVNKSELVPGDILLLEKGDVMPCDGILLKQSALKILEASVTGTRVPVFKRSYDQVAESNGSFPYFECLLFAGSVILTGTAKVFVCNTGKDIFDNENFTVSRQNTSVPKIYDTAMELKKQISMIWILACFFLFALGVFQGQSIFSAFYYVVGVVIAAFPDAIEHFCDLAIADMTLCLFREGVILRNPGAMDRLGDANSIFVNSGDYLFYTQPVAGSYYLGEKLYDFKKDPKYAAPLLESMLLAQNDRAFFAGKSDEWNAEKAIMSAAASIGIQKVRLDKEFLHIKHYNPDSVYDFSCSLVMFDGAYRLIVRGKPHAVVACCSKILRNGEARELTALERVNLRANARHLAGSCEKIIAVAVLPLSSPSTGDQRLLCKNMTYLGLFGLSTPVSAASANAVNMCQKSGIKTYLMTDDYPEIVVGLSKSVSIIGESDYQYALSYGTYERLDKGVFLADIEKYKAYCGFPVEEKQNIVKYHKDNGNITLSLTGGMYDTLPQMESDISVVGSAEKQNAVRLNSDLILKEKRFELIPLCINWARIFYRNIVHIMQYALLIQFALGFSVLLSFGFEGAQPYPLFPLILASFGAALPCAFNLMNRKPEARLEDRELVLKDDRVASLQVLVIIPMVAGTSLAISMLISRQIAVFATGNYVTATGAAMLTFLFASYFSSLSMKCDRSIFGHWKELDKISVITLLTTILSALILTVSPLTELWRNGTQPSPYNFWVLFFAFFLSLIPAAVMEWMKVIKKDDSAFERSQNVEKGEMK